MDKNKDVLEKIVKSIYDNEKAGIDEIVSALPLDLERYRDPERFYLFLQFDMNNVSKAIAEKLFKGVHQDKLDLLCVHYDFFEKHIEKLLISRIGISSSRDRSRHILSLYKNFLTDGTYKEEDFSEEHYWIPTFGTYMDWMNFCDSLYDLYYGNPDKYLISLKVLLNANIRKYPHTRYSWHMELKDGNSFKYQSRIDDTSNPFRTTEEHYLIPKRFLPHSSYKICEETYIDYLLMVPKEDVKNVYCETEEILM